MQRVGNQRVGRPAAFDSTFLRVAALTARFAT